MYSPYVTDIFSCTKIVEKLFYSSHARVKLPCKLVKYGGRRKKFAIRFVMGRGVCASAIETLETPLSAHFSEIPAHFYHGIAVR